MASERDDAIDDRRTEHRPAETPLVNHGYRATGVRLGCPKCGLRFLLPLDGDYGLGAALENLRAIIEGPDLTEDVSLLRAFSALDALEQDARVRLEQRANAADWDETRMEVEAIAQVARRLRNAEARSQHPRET